MNKVARVGIQVFALNMAADWPNNEKALDMALTAAVSSGLKLLFSFDYPGANYTRDQDVVIRDFKVGISSSILAACNPENRSLLVSRVRSMHRSGLLLKLRLDVSSCQIGLLLVLSQPQV